MKRVTVAILGASGAVGEEMLTVLQQRQLPIRLRLFASEKSAGQTRSFCGEMLTLQRVTEGCFDGCDYVLGAVSAPLARQYAPIIRKAGGVFIDNSSAFRLQKDVPLVVPQINGSDAFSHSGIVANPNCVTAIALMAVAAIERQVGIRRIIASSYQAVSGAGAGGIAELQAQERALFAQCSAAQPRVFAHPIARNLIPCIGEVSAEGSTAEEQKLANESRKILHRGDDLLVSCSCVRVPVLRCHSVSLCLETMRPISAVHARALIAAFAGCVLVDDADGCRFPMPLYAAGQDGVLVGRVREDAVFANGLSLFCCGDQLRKGAASNAVDILQLLAGL